MLKKIAIRKLVTLLVGFTVIGISLSTEAAQERKSPLTNAPAIRKRLELRNNRVEFGVGAGVTIGQDFYNALLIMPRLSYHMTDWLALGVFGGLNVTKKWKSTFNSDLQEALDLGDKTLGVAKSSDPKTPTAPIADATMNRINNLAGAQIEFLPLAGKLALFGNAFMYFDFYIFGGAAIVNLINSGNLPGACADSNLSASDALFYSCSANVEKGMKIAANGGLGAHAFLNNYLAIAIEIRDLVYKNNSAGRDVNGDKKTNSSDLKLTNNFLCSINLQVFLPSKPRVSR
jgi:outer membrane beta-barrel protein